MEVRVALIVGAGLPLGQQVARSLAAAGLRVALNDLLPNHIEALAAELNAAGGQAAAYPTDLSRKLGLQTMLQAILESWGRIDILLLIPAVRPSTALLDLDEWDWHRALDLNLTAAFLCVQSVGRAMRELGSGLIITVIGETEANSAVYPVAAAGLEALTKAAAAELGAYNIQVHSFSGKQDPQAILQLCLKERAPISSL